MRSGDDYGEDSTGSDTTDTELYEREEDESTLNTTSLSISHMSPSKALKLSATPVGRSYTPQRSHSPSTSRHSITHSISKMSPSHASDESVSRSRLNMPKIFLGGEFDLYEPTRLSERSSQEGTKRSGSPSIHRRSGIRQPVVGRTRSENGTKNSRSRRSQNPSSVMRGSKSPRSPRSNKASSGFKEKKRSGSIGAERGGSVDGSRRRSEISRRSHGSWRRSSQEGGTYQMGRFDVRTVFEIVNELKDESKVWKDDQVLPETMDLQKAAKKIKKHRKDYVPFSDLVFGELVGEGTFGKVYRGMLWGQDVAIKTIKSAQLTFSATERRDFWKEVKVMRRLRHPNIVELLGVSVQGDQMCIITEFMDGGTLKVARRKLKTGGALLCMSPDSHHDGSPHKDSDNSPIKYFMNWFLDIANGLSWLHHKGIIHRDLKPANLLVDESGRCKLADFGLAHIKHDENPNQGVYELCGTPCYMAPEVIRKDKYNNKCDVFSLAVVICELLTGHYPYESGQLSRQTFQSAIVAGLRPKIPEWVPEILKDLIRSCWSDNPNDRPDIDAVVVVLRTLRDSLGVDQMLIRLRGPALELVEDLRFKLMKLEAQVANGRTLLLEEKEKVMTTREELTIALARAEDAEKRCSRLMNQLLELGVDSSEMARATHNRGFTTPPLVSSRVLPTKGVLASVSVSVALVPGPGAPGS